MTAIRIATTLIAWLDRHAPRWAARARRWLAGYLIPFHRAAGIRVVNVSGNAARVVIRRQRRASNQNGSGTVHGGVILALAESVHGVAVLWRFAPRLHRMFTRSARIGYRTPGRGELFVDYRTPPGLHSRIERELKGSNRSELELASEVTDAHGTTVAEHHATYVVQRLPARTRSR